MVATAKHQITDAWVTATWDEYSENIELPDYEKAKGYYYNGKYRIEMTPIGNDHSNDHSNTASPMIASMASAAAVVAAGPPGTGPGLWGSRPSGGSRGS